MVTRRGGGGGRWGHGVENNLKPGREDGGEVRTIQRLEIVEARSGRHIQLSLLFLLSLHVCTWGPEIQKWDRLLHSVSDALVWVFECGLEERLLRLHQMLRLDEVEVGGSLYGKKGDGLRVCKPFHLMMKQRLLDQLLRERGPRLALLPSYAAGVGRPANGRIQLHGLRRIAAPGWLSIREERVARTPASMTAVGLISQRLQMSCHPTLPRNNGT